MLEGRVHVDQSAGEETGCVGGTCLGQSQGVIALGVLKGRSVWTNQENSSDSAGGVCPCGPISRRGISYYARGHVWANQQGEAALIMQKRHSDVGTWPHGPVRMRPSSQESLAACVLRGESGCALAYSFAGSACDSASTHCSLFSVVC